MNEKYYTKNISWFRSKVLSWYSNNARNFPWRNKSATKYQVIVSEILLQRTKAEVVAIFYSSFFQKFSSWRSLSKSNEVELEKFLKPLGLWKHRASVLMKLSREMVKRNGRFPVCRIEIEKLPGIGQYIANAIEMFCHGIPRPLLDVNMAGVLERFFGPRHLADIRYDPYIQDLSKRIIPKKNAKAFNWAILDFASRVCRSKRPLCYECPLSSECLFFICSQTCPENSLSCLRDERER